MKYLFTIPQGGFSNICHIIWICYEYCKKYKRTLVIDTRYVSTFRDDIRKYLIFHSDSIFTGDIDDLFTTLKNKPMYPGQLAKVFQREEYSSVIRKLKFTKMGYMFKVSDDNTVNFKIDLNKEYSEDLIFFSNCGGGKGLKELFEMVDFSTSLKTYINNRFKCLPNGYISIHIRHTDRKSYIAEFLKVNEAHFKNKDIFIASDNYECINMIKDIYKTRVYRFANIPDIQGKPIHENNVKLKIDEFILDCISDMILLCFGNKFYYSCHESGYSKNVTILRETGIEILKRLLKN